MAEQSTHINYTFDDIQRYLQGKMAAAEMHAMEKAALQDPFLADAIEGYREIPSAIAGQHLNEINAAFAGEHKTSRIISFKRNSPWMRVAALIIVLAGVGVIGFYVLNTSHNKQNVAQVKKEDTINSTAPVLQDSQQNKTATESFKADEEKNKVAQAKREKKEYKPKSSPEEINDVAANNESESANHAANAARMKAEPAPVAGNEDQDEKRAYNSLINAPANKKTDSLQTLQGYALGINVSPITISGKVIDENGEAIPGVIIQSADRKVTTFTDPNGDFNLKQPDSVVNVLASAVGFQDKTLALKAGDRNNVMMVPNNGSLNEVVVTTALTDSIKNKGISPVGGWDNFHRYVQMQLNEDTTNDYYPDDDFVELEFSINKSGDPANVKFLRSLDEQRDARALDILKQGPKWISAKNQKIRIRISF